MTISKELLAALHEKECIVIIPDIQGERALCQRWLQRNAPKVRTERRVFEELELASLQKGVQVVFMFRDPEMPLVNYTTNAAGVLVPTARPDEELFEELRFTKPTVVDEAYWTQDNPLRPGKVNIPLLLEHFGKITSPYRLDFVDKCAQRPTIMRLKKL